MILFYQVVQVFALSDGDSFFVRFTGIERTQRHRIDAAFIDGHRLRFAVMADGLAKEAQRGRGVPPGDQQKVNSMTRSINRPIQVFPLAFEFLCRFHPCASGGL